ncbi:MAG: PIN domain-containing protein [Aquabacterium sp.]|nr:PIN domain-containing protein [Aquabacterium sp.]
MTQQVIRAPTAPPDAQQPVTPVVIDTNVLLDLLVFSDPRALPLRQALDSGRLAWLATAAMVEELETVVARALTSEWGTTAEAVLAGCMPWRSMVEPPPPAAAGGPRCTDASDQKFIDLALSRRVPWLLTHDRALLRLRRAAARRGVAVLTPQAWAASRERNVAANPERE